MPIDNFDDVTHLDQDDTSSVYAEDKDIYNKKINYMLGRLLVKIEDTNVTNVTRMKR